MQRIFSLVLEINHQTKYSKKVGIKIKPKIKIALIKISTEIKTRMKMELALKKRIKTKVKDARKFWIKTTLIGKTELLKIVTVKERIRMVLVMEPTIETEQLILMLTLMDLKTGLSMERMIIIETKIIRQIDILRKVTEANPREMELLTVILKSKTLKTRL
jgi:hypothetical protein